MKQFEATRDLINTYKKTRERKGLQNLDELIFFKANANHSKLQYFDREDFTRDARQDETRRDQSSSRTDFFDYQATSSSLETRSKHKTFVDDN